MNWFEKFFYAIDKWQMTEPHAWGWFHLLTLGIMIALIVLVCLVGKQTEKKLRIILLTYAITATVLEIVKQIIFSMHYNDDGTLYWRYQWYAAPFQLCTTPIIAAFIIVFVKNEKIRSAMAAYMAFITILGSLSVILLPDDCLIESVEVNIHTTFLHYGSFVISMYFLITGIVKIKLKNLLNALLVFLCFACFAYILNEFFYHTHILPDGQTFNMFYISPHFDCALPVLVDIQKKVPHLVFLLAYGVAVVLGSMIIYGISLLVEIISHKLSKKENSNEQITA